MVNQTPINPSQAQMMARLKLERQLRGGASWFYWIAGLSIINSILFILDISSTFVVGLGITQVIDGISAGIADLTEPGMMPMIRTIGLVINIVIAGGFVAFGILGSNRRKWAIIVGMVLYALDIIILIIAMDWLSILFHAIALVGLVSGLSACSKLEKLDAQSLVVPPERIAGIY